MLKVIETKEEIEIQSLMLIRQGALFLLLALVPLLAPYELIVRPHWQHYVNVIFLFAAAISAGAIAVSALLAWAALAGLRPAPMQLFSEARYVCRQVCLIPGWSLCSAS